MPDAVKICEKNLFQQIDVVAEFHANKISPHRIAYRTGIDLQLIKQLINGEAHPRRFQALLARHRRARRDQRLQKALRHKGVAQSNLRTEIEREFQLAHSSGQ